MKRIYRKLLTIVTFLPVLTGGVGGGSLLLSACNSWLDVQPRSQVEDTELFETENGFKEALAGVYSSMVNTQTYAKELTYGFIGVLGREWDYYSAGQYGESDVATYDYDGTIATNHIRGIWNQNYSGIANVNNLLAHIDENPSLFSRDNYAVIKGEALALRAFLHFDLLRCFGVSYAVNPDQPAIPYSTALSYRVFPQLTVRQVLESVKEDLRQAEALLKEADPIVTGREITETTDNGYLLNRQLHLNYYAVRGLQARVLMWACEYDLALAAADEVIKSELFPWAVNTQLQTGADRSLATEHLFALNNLTLQADIADIYFSEGTTNSFAVTRDRLLEYFDRATRDYRYTFLFKNGTGSNAANRYLRKYDEATGGVFYNNKMPLIRVPEMYLIRSEVLYRNGEAEEALSALNDLRVARNLTRLTRQPDDFLLELIREYRREYLGEGQLFFLFKRLNRPTILLFPEADAVEEKLYTFPLPITETEAAEREANK
ncbi:MAG: RagB/SusD family nutrient uptake outer membrane protein [Bacteroidaceae bacterium]|nr:RagB/SusD family nutrient uptake outer membrane protein [Bacteroidaceae bacterium]